MLAAVGDSKTADGRMQIYMTSNHPELEWVTGTLAWGGRTASALAAELPAALAATSGTPAYVLLNIGTNDISQSTAQATYETGLASALDQLHAKWPAAVVGVSRPWVRGKDAQCDTMDDVWITNVLASRGPWAVVGPDERVVIKSTDDGVTYSPDGYHPNGPGYYVLGEAWIAELGILP